MAYQLIPNPNDKLSVSQDDILDNFTTANTLFGVDHRDFLTGDGKHKAVHLVNQTLAPAAPVTSAGECAIYSAPGVGAIPALFFKSQSSGAGVNGVDFTSAGKTNPGWLRLPSGIIIKWGTSPAINYNAAGSVGDATIASGAGVPMITTLLNYQVSANAFSGSDLGVFQVFAFNDTAAPVAGVPAFTTRVRVLKIFTSSLSGSASYNWLAIGV